jgi:Rieske Fe-S protein
MSSKLSDAIDKVMSDERDVRAASSSYQSEFPHHRDDEAQVTRREFCNFLFLTSSALMLGSAGFAAKAAFDKSTPKTYAAVEVEGAAALSPGSSINFAYPGKDDPAILVRAKDGEYYAYDQKCTHLTCPVYYAKESDRLECPCHEGGFDVHNGNVLYGPPPRALDKIEIEIRGDRVFATDVIKGGGHGKA